MNQLVCKIFLVLALTISMLNNANAIEADDKKCSTLFKIGRSKDANEIYYEVKTNQDGSLNLNEPINIYWIKYTKNGTIEPLTKIQQHFAYGLKFLNITSEEADFQFVSYSKRNLTLRKTVEGNYAVFIKVHEKEVRLERVFIQIDGGTFWFPKITRVEVHAKKAEPNELVVEVINP